MVTQRSKAQLAHQLLAAAAEQALRRILAEIEQLSGKARLVPRELPDRGLRGSLEALDVAG